MITVFCMNKYGKRFTKEFDNPYQARIFVLRCKHGHNVLVEGVELDYNNEETLNYAAGR